MSEAEREAFLARFHAGGRGIGFAVLGGAFGEGDRPAGRPSDRRLRRDARAAAAQPGQRADEGAHGRRLFGAGYDYTYLFPGLAEGGAGGRPRDPQRTDDAACCT